MEVLMVASSIITVLLPLRRTANSNWLMNVAVNIFRGYERKKLRFAL